MEHKLVHIYVEKAEVYRQLAAAEDSGPYVVLKYNGLVRQSEAVPNTASPEWKVEFVCERAKKGSRSAELSVWSREERSAAAAAAALVGTATIPDTDVFSAGSDSRVRQALSLVGGTGEKTGELFAESWLTITADYAVLAYPDAGSVYEGAVRNGVPHGHGTCWYASGVRYEGEWVEGVAQGRGVCVYPDGIVYDGEWVADQKEGRGTQTWPSGHEYRGDWVQGRMEGRGVYSFPSGSRYTGSWLNNKQHGIARTRGATGRSTWGIGRTT